MDSRGSSCQRALNRSALDTALGQRVLSQTGLVFHADRGSQYVSGDYRAALLKADITCSISRRANCWDKALAESFLGTLKTELIHTRIFFSVAVDRTVIAEWSRYSTTDKEYIRRLGIFPPGLFHSKF